MKYLKFLKRVFFPTSLANFFSEEGKEASGLATAVSVSYGRYAGRVTTQADFQREMEAMEARVNKRKGFLSRLMTKLS